MASFAETLYKAPTKAERIFFFVSVDFLIHSQTVREHMYDSFD